MHRQLTVDGELSIENSQYPMTLKASGREVKIDLCGKEFPVLAGLPVSFKNVIRINSLIRSSGLKVTLVAQDKFVMSLGSLIPIPGLYLIKRLVT